MLLDIIDCFIHILFYIGDKGKAAEVWAIALSEDGQYLAGTTQDGHIKVWDLEAERKQIRDFETKGSFGMCIALVWLYTFHFYAVLETDIHHFSRRMVVLRQQDTKMEAFIFSATIQAGCHFHYQVGRSGNVYAMEDSFIIVD